jgi:hypothetical protein
MGLECYDADCVATAMPSAQDISKKGVEDGNGQGKAAADGGYKNNGHGVDNRPDQESAEEESLGLCNDGERDGDGEDKGAGGSSANSDRLAQGARRGVKRKGESKDPDPRDPKGAKSGEPINSSMAQKIKEKLGCVPTD